MIFQSALYHFHTGSHHMAMRLCAFNIFSDRSAPRPSLPNQCIHHPCDRHCMWWCTTKDQYHRSTSVNSPHATQFWNHTAVMFSPCCNILWCKKTNLRWRAHNEMLTTPNELQYNKQINCSHMGRAITLSCLGVHNNLADHCVPLRVQLLTDTACLPPISLMSLKAGFM